MRKKRLASDLTVSAIGLGCASMSHGYGPQNRDDVESTRVIHAALDAGITLFDTADVYGPHTNEELLGLALTGVRGGVLITTKCGLVPEPGGRFSRNARPDHLHRACEASLRRLRTDVIDLYQLHRVDPEVPLEETWGALSDLVAQGKVRGLGISHATLDELRTIHALHPLTAVQYELSVWATRHCADVLPWCIKQGVGYLAFAPLGRGYLSGRLDLSALVPGDSRHRDPRFGALAHRVNQKIVAGLEAVAARHGATAAQVAIAWTLRQGEGVVPIPGTRHLSWLRENTAAVDLHLTDADLAEIAELPPAVGDMDWDGARRVGAPSPTDRQPATIGARDHGGAGA